MVNANSALPRLPKEPYPRHLVTPSRGALGLGKIERMTRALQSNMAAMILPVPSGYRKWQSGKKLKNEGAKCEVLNAYLANPNLPHAVATHRKDFDGLTLRRIDTGRRLLWPKRLSTIVAPTRNAAAQYRRERNIVARPARMQPRAADEMTVALVRTRSARAPWRREKTSAEQSPSGAQALASRRSHVGSAPGSACLGKSRTATCDILLTLGAISELGKIATPFHHAW